MRLWRLINHRRLAMTAKLAPTALEGSSKGPRTAHVGSSTGSEEDDGLLTVESGGGKASQEEDEQFEMQLGPVKTTLFAVYHVCNIIFLRVRPKRRT